MTEQPPSASDIELRMAVLRAKIKSGWRSGSTDDDGDALCNELAALIAQRVAAETERWENRDRQRLEQIDRLQETVQRCSTGDTKEQTHRHYYDAFHAWFMQSGCDFWRECDAPETLATIAVELHDNAKAALASTAERPASPQRHLTGGERKVLHKALLASSRLVHEGELAPALASTVEQQPFRDAVRVAFDNFFARKVATRRASVEPTGTGEQPAPEASFAADLAAAQEPLGAEFEKVLHDNLDQLYVRSEPPAAVVDYTERARAIWDEAYDNANHIVSYGKTTKSFETTLGEIAVSMLADALSAVASERDAAAIRAFGKRAWSDGEDVAYQAGVSDTLARLQEPNVREAVAKAIYDIDPIGVRDWSNAPVSTREDCFACADAALTKMAEMLK